MADERGHTTTEQPIGAEHDFAVEVVYDNDQHKHFVVLREKINDSILFVIDPYDAMKLGSSINNCGIIAQVLSTPQPHEHATPLSLGTIGVRQSQDRLDSIANRLKQ